MAFIKPEGKWQVEFVRGVDLFGAELPRIMREYEACIALIKPKEDNQQGPSPHHLLPLSGGVKSCAKMIRLTEALPI